jgi:1-aminocyclopropane-1-carboxylate deaminase/D-cysteine desulfhydrase-like pyridoxal-dependent ACC family enzyme
MPAARITSVGGCDISLLFYTKIWAKVMVISGTGGVNDFLRRGWVHPVKHPLLDQYPVSTDILRLDRIHPQISGNKWLKLDYWLQKFRQGNYKGILTAGGPWSNHLHACAFACFENGIPMKALVKGHEAISNAMLDDLLTWKVSLRFVNRGLFYQKDHWENYASENNLLFIPMGGDGPEGVAGVTRWLNQLPLGTYDEIFCSVGTGTTLEGIAVSNLQYSQLTGTEPGTGDKKLEDKIAAINQHLPGKTIRLLPSGERMGKLTPDIQFFMQDWFHKTGIMADFVYTAPMFKLFLEMVTKNAFTPGSRVLLIHTGGLQGNRSIEGFIS